MSNTSDIQFELQGKIVPRSFSAGYVILSYLVSFVGAWTTLELINRRTAGRGLYNWFLLIGSSISMGGIAIWCMHFIGNRAIILGGGNQSLQIAYNSGFTALSFFVPIFVLLAAFLAVGSNDSVSPIRLGLGGTLAGLAICGMHYLGQTGISNYTSVYHIGNVIGSAAVAVFASITALTVFFVLRASWTNSWWKRAGTAVILAGAVSGMHWLASVGTQYRLKAVQPTGADYLSNNSTVIVVIVLSISACFILLAFTLIAQRRRSKSANRAQQVVLAAGVFDSEGRLMVTPNGELPTQKITNEYIERSFDDIFGISHPAFLWIFRTTRNWLGISGLVTPMRNHIQHTSMMKGSRPGTKGAELSLTDDAGNLIEDYSIIFRELFCIAAADLASQMGEPLEKMGVLFDEILSTGQKITPNAKSQKGSDPKSPVDTERGGIMGQYFGRGQLLFLTRRVNRRESEQLAARGYRFATISNVVNILSSSMQINSADLLARLETMKEYSLESHILEPGVHFACFSIRASVNGGFDVLVRKDASNQLPTMQLPLEKLETWQLEYLSGFDGNSVATCLKLFKSKATLPTLQRKEQAFAAQLHDTLEALRDEIDDPFFNDALLVAKPVMAPCRGLGGEDAVPGQALLISFRIIVPIHSRAPGTKLFFIPLSFFKLQQHVYENSPDHAVFSRKIHREFGPILNRAPLNSPRDLKSPASSKFSRFGGSTKSNDEVRSQLDRSLPTLVNRNSASKNPFHFWARKNSLGADTIELGMTKNSSDTSSEKNLVEATAFGGIMVSQEVSIDVRDLAEGEKVTHDDGDDEKAARKRAGTSERLRIGTTGVASKEDDDPETYVDKLFAVCVESR